jgi:hypothetical protein
MIKLNKSIYFPIHPFIKDTILVRTKICGHCLIRKIKEDFSKDNSRKDKLQSWCKQCQEDYNSFSGIKKIKSEYNKLYYQRNKK